MASQPDSTSGATPLKGEAAWAMSGVGGVRSSDDPVPDLWFGESTEERRDATCSAGGRATKDVVTAREGYKRPKTSGSCKSTWRCGSGLGARNSESRMRENRPSGLMRGGKQTGKAVTSRLLYRITWLRQNSCLSCLSWTSGSASLRSLRSLRLPPHVISGPLPL